MCFPPAAVGDRCGRCRFRGLAARIEVDFGVEDEHVHIVPGCQYVIQAAVADVICLRRRR